MEGSGRPRRLNHRTNQYHGPAERFIEALTGIQYLLTMSWWIARSPDQIPESGGSHGERYREKRPYGGAIAAVGLPRPD
jgi:hypothetical protein